MDYLQKVSFLTLNFVTWRYLNFILILFSLLVNIERPTHFIDTNFITYVSTLFDIFIDFLLSFIIHLFYINYKNVKL